MVKNMGKIDRVVRILLAVVVAVLFFTGQLTGTAAIVLGILAVVFIATAAIGTCPLYMPFKISTNKK
jgi:K+-transporting ATPase A subunit